MKKVKPDPEVSSSRALVHVGRDENDESPGADARSGRETLETGCFTGLAAELAYLVPDLRIVHCPECGSVEVDNPGDGERLCCLVCDVAWEPPEPSISDGPR